jgi:Flp pilus assembly protein TadB
MSKQRARKRAEDRAKKRAPKSRPATTEVERSAPKKKARQRSNREQRRRRRLWAIGIIWLLANAAIWIFFDTWNARVFGVMITTILVPLVVWLVWDPEGRVDL